MCLDAQINNNENKDVLPDDISLTNSFINKLKVDDTTSIDVVTTIVSNDNPEQNLSAITEIATDNVKTKTKIKNNQKKLIQKKKSVTVDNQALISQEVKIKHINFGNGSTKSTNTEITQQFNDNTSSSFLTNLPTLKTFGINVTNHVSSNDNNTNDEEIPQVIKGKYKEDFNILDVHNSILKKFQYEKNKYLFQLHKKRDLELLKMKKPQNMVERKNSLHQLEVIEKEIHKITDEEELKNYLSQVSELIELYKELGTIPKIISFKSKEKVLVPDESHEKQTFRHLIISRYLEIARSYIQIDIIHDVESNTKCPGCDQQHDESYIDDSGMQYCPQCFLEREVVAKTPFYKDNSRVNTSSRNNYEDRENFLKAMMRFQGKQPNNLPPNLFPQLDNYFKSYGLPTGEDVKQLPLDNRGRRGKTNKDMIYKALYDIGYASFYEDVNLLCHLYWGWDLPDISHLEDTIMDDYDLSQRVYERIKIDRKSCLNTQYRLFKHLQHRGYPCRADDFKIVKTREILEYHEEMWKRICEVLSWKFIQTI